MDNNLTGVRTRMLAFVVGDPIGPASCNDESNPLRKWAGFNVQPPDRLMVCLLVVRHARLVGIAPSLHWENPNSTASLAKQSQRCAIWVIYSVVGCCQ